MDRSDLAARMKTYEAVSRNFLTRRVPVILRFDGKSFHTFTKGMKAPFDDVILLEAMRQTMKHLCENIQGCVFGYTQSDEITLILTDYKTIHTSAWFDYNVQKMTSIGASMATLAFNKAFGNLVQKLETGELENCNVYTEKDIEVYSNKKSEGAMFDCRAFNIPFDDVCNNIVWRQADCTRNSIEAVGQYYFSTKELHKKNCNEIQDMLMVQKGINWNDFPIHLKRGAACIKDTNLKKIVNIKGIDTEITYTGWIIDKEMPIITKDRDYVESRIDVRED